MVINNGISKVNFIENSSVVGPDNAPTGRVRVHFENKEQTTLDGTVETVLLKIGGSRDDMERKPRSDNGHPYGPAGR